MFHATKNTKSIVQNMHLIFYDTSADDKGRVLQRGYHIRL